MPPEQFGVALRAAGSMKPCQSTEAPAMHWSCSCFVYDACPMLHSRFAGFPARSRQWMLPDGEWKPGSVVAVAAGPALGARTPRARLGWRLPRGYTPRLAAGVTGRGV